MQIYPKMLLLALPENVGPASLPHCPFSIFMKIKCNLTKEAVHYITWLG